MKDTHVSGEHAIARGGRGGRRGARARGDGLPLVRALSHVAALVFVAATIGCGEPYRAPPPIVVPSIVVAATDHEKIALAGQHLRVESDVTAAGTLHTIRYPKAEGMLLLAPAAIEATRVEVDIDVRVAEAGWQLVADLGRSHFLEVDRFAKARFVSRAIERRREPTTGSPKYVLYGDLELHGVVRAVAIDVSVSVDDCRARFSSTFVIDRRDYGMVPSGPIDAVVGNEVTMRLSLDAPRATRKASCPAG